ncbi:multicopper oxidase family protein [Plantactinospora sp. GCM10030261]|uniref:multicopper oxidase family protein n=1 Tax=Plantactinospora sp. GCM10030261 TaxID=3273420 RepID=UPI00361DC271
MAGALVLGGALPGRRAAAGSPSPAAPPRAAGPLLDPTAVPKYGSVLPIPPAMPAVSRAGGIDRYLIAVRQFRQQILPVGLPATTVWGYGSAAHRGTFSYPAFTIVARVGRPVRVTWLNQLVDGRGRYLPHLLPVDPTLHWANPPGGVTGRDSMPDFTGTPGPYRGPVPMVVHLHGGHTRPDSDGYPEAWWLPNAVDIPAGYARVGSFYDEFRAAFQRRTGVRWAPGSATFQYDNDQRAATEWLHDHTLGMTRQNVYAGPAGFYLLRGGAADLAPGVLPGPAPAPGDPPGLRYREIPIAIQDRTFTVAGALHYPAIRSTFDGYPGPYVPVTDVPPIWHPEVFGDTIVVNGRTWPVLPVGRQRYRLRLLNGCNSRFLILRIASDPLAPRPAPSALPIWQIGSDGGFLPAPVEHDSVLVAPAQRVDAIVDFSGVPVGAELYLINEGPDGPFAGGAVGVDFPPADADTTGQVLKFVVGPRDGPDPSVPPDRLRLPRFTPLGRPSAVRRLLLAEQDSTVVDDVGPVAALLGTVSGGGVPTPLRWHDTVTECPRLGATEVWELHNTTMDAHPIHLHLVQFQVLGRGVDGRVPPPPQERGFHDTVTALPGEITRIAARFDVAGRYVWHCHILEHEDNEMMRPYQVG